MNNSTSKLHVIIPASGSGSRFNSKKPKQYFEVAADTILAHTIKLFTPYLESDRAFNASVDKPIKHSIASINVVVNVDDDYYKSVATLSTFSLYSQHKKLNWLKCGGDTRAESVYNGLLALSESGIVGSNDWILVHDAARCLLSSNVLGSLINYCLITKTGAIVAIPATDTVKMVLNENSNFNPSSSGVAGNSTMVTDIQARTIIDKTIDRRKVYLAQTPQMFLFRDLLKGFKQAFAIAIKQGVSIENLVTDEASIIELTGGEVGIVVGDKLNFKITYPVDLKIADLILSNKLLHFGVMSN
jgi:2-C-methyl-D-erythritol 4-phosphate cytidylyltransferase